LALPTAPCAADDGVMLVGLIVVNCLLVAGGIVMVSQVRKDAAARRREPRRVPASHPSRRVVHPAEFGLALVYVEFDGDAFVLDGILTEDNDEVGSAGCLLTLRLPLSGTRSVDAWMHAHLDQWTAGDAPVHCALNGDERHPRASITDGSSTLHFSANVDRHAA